MCPLVSVIIPVYNSEDTLAHCLDSILKQTYKNLEIILVDDASVDKSCSICDLYINQDKRIKIVHHKKNQGAFFSRMSGLREAKGIYVVFVDSDDWMEQDALEFFIDKMEQGYDFIATGLIIDNSGEESEWLINEIECHGEKRKKLLFIEGLFDLNENSYSICPSSCAKCYERSFISTVMKEITFNHVENLIYYEDLITTLTCVLKSDSFACYSELFYHYVMRPGSVMYNLRKQCVYDEFLHIYAVLELLSRHGIFLKEEYVGRKIFWRILEKEQLLLDTIHRHIPSYCLENMDVLLNKRIILYGAGRIGRDLYAQISKYEKCKIVAWIDSNAQKYSYEYREVKTPDALRNEAFDIVLIGVLSSQLAADIKKELLAMEIKDEKILWLKPNLLDEPLNFPMFMEKY